MPHACAPMCCCHLARAHRRYDESNHKRLAPTPGGGVSPAILVQAGGRFFYATAARLLALKFILSMSVSAGQGRAELCAPWIASTAQPAGQPPPQGGALRSAVSSDGKAVDCWGVSSWAQPLGF